MLYGLSQASTPPTLYFKPNFMNYFCIQALS